MPVKCESSLYNIIGICMSVKCEFSLYVRRSSGCGLGGAGGVTYSVKNLIQEPHFFYTIRLPLLGCNDTTLVKYMEKACDRDKGRFKGLV